MKRYLATAILCLLGFAGSTGVMAGEKIRAFEPESFRQIADSHKGKPFMVMIWSLDCEYCLASFKALSEAGRSGRVRIVTIATDLVDDPQAVKLMAETLATAGLDKEAWAFGAAPAEQLRYAIDPKWHGEKPRSYWFDARGERVAYSGIITAATIDRLTVSWRSGKAR